MEKLNEQIGKAIIALNEGEEVGYILDLCFDESLKEFKGFVVCDKEAENESFIPVDSVKAVNNDFIFIDSVKDFEPFFDSVTNNPYGKNVFDKTGVDLGRVKAVQLQGNKIIKFVTDKGEIRPQFIFSSGRDCLIFSKTRSAAKRSFVRSKTVLLPKVEIMGSDMPPEEVAIPAKISASPAVLLNRTATADILGLNNELIIRKGEIITQNKLEKAKKHNKLNNLMFNSK